MTYAHRSRIAPVLAAALGAIVLAAAGARPVLADGALATAIAEGKPILDLRYRYETVDQDGFAETATAHTLRARAGYETAPFRDLILLAEVEAVLNLGSEDFNDTVNGRVQFPVIADPETFEINRLQLSWTGIEGASLTLGRQRLNFDDQRFVGAVGFRQNEQTFDAVRLAYARIEKLTVNYVFGIQANRVFGNESSQGEFSGPLHFFNAAFTDDRIGTLTGFAYLISVHEAPILSTETFGLRFAGTQSLSDSASIAYAASYATQSDYAANPRDIDLNYWMLEGTLAFGAFSAGVGEESLGGDGVTGFSAPLGTLHKFQGFADVFLNTPANGIVDVWARAGIEQPVAWSGVTNVSLTVWYHDFETERGGVALGEEIDVEAWAKIDGGFRVGLKYASFETSSAYASRDKFWFAVEYVL